MPPAAGPSARMHRWTSVACLLAVLWGPSASGDTDIRAQIGAVLPCVFDATDARCEIQDWNDDGIVSAADVAGRLRFSPPAATDLRIIDTGPAVVLRSAAAKVRINK